jgi:hypothetical protein
MAAYELRILDLRAPLPYTGIENPSFAGGHPGGSVLVPIPEGRLLEIPTGPGLSEGDEEIFLFDEESLIEFDADNGPKIVPRLPTPGFYGRRNSTGGAVFGGAALERRELPRGRYAFMQWRADTDEELLLGMEWFARETWWEQLRGEGPCILRRLREEGKLASQMLRRLTL